MTLKHFDAFTGYGGFTLGLEDYARTIGFSEVDKYANALLKFRFPFTKNYGDINEIKMEELPDFDILTGGTPCQDLSIAGKRGGLSKKRSGLFFSFVEILKEKKPSYFIWENVKGAFSSNKGFDFLQVQVELAEAGYDYEFGLVNAKWFVPQNRERIFIVGYLRGGCGGKVFPIEGKGRKDHVVGKDISFCLDANYYKGVSPAGYQSKRRQLVRKVNRVGTLDIKGHDYIKRVYGNGLAPTLPTSCGGNHMPKIKILDGIRRLTPIECERLMGLEDEWTKWGKFGNKTKEISDTQRYKLCGNGVVVPVVKEIIRRIVQ